MKNLQEFLLTNLVLLRDNGIIISPYLAGVNKNILFYPSAVDLINKEADDYFFPNWIEMEKIKRDDEGVVSYSLAKRCVSEIFSATSLLIAHNQTGDLQVNDETASKGISRVKDFCTEYGFETLIDIHQLLTAYEGLNALTYYKSISELDFLNGSYHRPWANYLLIDELNCRLDNKVMQITIRNKQRYVEITPRGQELYEILKHVLSESGYFTQITRLVQISQFTNFNEYEQLAEEIWPKAMPSRIELIKFAGIEPGMEVLEIGCGSGALTFEAGLARRISKKGRLVSTDPSAGMIYRAKAKPQAKKMSWVEFQIAKAEALPFEDNSFDVAIGWAFMHFTERNVALKEMRRVVRPGGVIASLHPVTNNYEIVPFFQEWFSPIFTYAGKRKEQVKSYLFSLEQGMEAFKNAGLLQIHSQSVPSPNLLHDPVKVVKHYINGVGFYQEELAELPWRARQEVYTSLLEQGKRVCEKYKKEERILPVVLQMIKGIVP